MRKGPTRAFFLTQHASATQPPFTRAGTLAPSAAAQYAGLLTRLVAMARSTVRATADGGAAGGGDELAFLRLRTLSREVMVVPGDEFLLVAIQAAALDDAAAA